MRPERSGLQAWHNALCAWCDAKATGDALFRANGWAIEYFASCGKHGDNFKAFSDQTGSIAAPVKASL